MKRLFCSVLLVSASLLVNAEIVNVEGICYNLNVGGSEAVVTENPDKYKGALSVPESVLYNGVRFAVTDMDDFAFSDCKELTFVSLPKSLSRIGNAVFRN